MAYSGILVLHILAAVATMAVIGYGLVALLYKRDAVYKRTVLGLGFIAAFQVFSGTLLAVLSPELSAAALTLHIVAYLGVCLGTEALLFMRMYNLSLAFPLRLAASPVLASVTLFVAAISYGF